MISINIFIEINDEQEWWWWWSTSDLHVLLFVSLWLSLWKKMTVSCKWISSYQKQKQKLLTSQIELKSVINIQAQYFRSP